MPRPMLATDLRGTLRAFVPEPPPLAVVASDDLPDRIRRPHLDLGPYHRKPDPEEVELRVRETSRAALLDVKAVLRLVDAGVVKVGEKPRRPSQASLKSVAGVLSEGDFYADADRCEWSHVAASALAVAVLSTLLVSGGWLMWFPVLSALAVAAYLVSAVRR